MARAHSLRAVLVAAVLCGCGTSDEGTADISYSGQCGSLLLWRQQTISPSIANARGLHCTLLQGQLPAGMALDPSTCAISGTPIQLERQDVVIRATASNVNGSTDRPCSLTVLGPAVTYGGALDLATHHFPGDLIFQSPIGSSWRPLASETLVYQAIGPLPPGLTLDPANGSVSGTLTWAVDPVLPSAPSPWWGFGVRATATGPLGTVSVEAMPSPGVYARLPYYDYAYGASVHLGSVGLPFTSPVPDPLPAELAGASSEFRLEAWGLGMTAGLPAGLALDGVTGVIAGTPTEPWNGNTGVTRRMVRNGVPFELHAYIKIFVP